MAKGDITHKIRTADADTPTTDFVSLYAKKTIDRPGGEPFFIGDDGLPFTMRGIQGPSAIFGSTVTVAKSGGQFTTLAGALADSVITSASASNPVAILWYSGIYDMADVTIIPFVYVLGFGNVIARPSAITTSAFFTITSDSTMRDIKIEGNGNASGSGAIGLKLNSGDTATITRIEVSDFNVNFNSSGAGTNLIAVHCSADLGTNSDTAIGFQATTDANLTAIAPSATGASPFSKLPIGYQALDSGSAINTIGGSSIFNTQSVVLNNSAVGTINSLSVVGADEAYVTLDGTGATVLTVLNPSIDSTTVLNHNLLDNNVGAKYIQSGGVFDRSKIVHSTNIQLLVASVDENENDENFRIVAELNQGTFLRQEESNFASGDSTVLGMSVFTNTNGEVGTTVDVTEAAASPSGSPVTMFAGVAAENCIYFIRPVKFDGFHLHELDTLMVLGGGSIIFEISTGAGEFDYTAVNVMEANSIDLDDVRANNVFVTNAGGELDIRLGDTTAQVSKTLFGKTGFILRVRITSAITTSPIFQQSKLHSNTLTIGTNGQIQLKGSARTNEIFPLPRLEDLIGFSAGNNSINTNINTDISQKNNNRANGVKDGSGFTISIPSGVDTSFPMVVTVVWAPGGVGAGDVENLVSIAPYTDNSILDGTITETTIAQIQTVNAQENARLNDTFSFDIPDVLPGDEINIGILRDATAGNLNDTFADSIYLVGNPQITFKKWRL